MVNGVLSTPLIKQDIHNVKTIYSTILTDKESHTIISENRTFDKGLPSRIYRPLSKISSQKTKIPTRGWVEDTEMFSSRGQKRTREERGSIVS